MPQTDSRCTLCTQVILHWFGVAAELTAEPLDGVSVGAYADIFEESTRNPHPPGSHLQAVEPIKRVRGDRCSSRDEETSLSCINATRRIYQCTCQWMVNER